jgi:hypothetical protein
LRLAPLRFAWHPVGEAVHIRGAAMDKTEIAKLETYFRRTFNNAAIKVVARAKKKDSAEVMIGDEFIGILFLDDEDGDKSYNFQMAILEEDLA